MASSDQPPPTPRRIAQYFERVLGRPPTQAEVTKARQLAGSTLPMTPQEEASLVQRAVSASPPPPGRRAAYAARLYDNTVPTGIQARAKARKRFGGRPSQPKVVRDKYVETILNKVLAKKNLSSQPRTTYNGQLQRPGFAYLRRAVQRALARSPQRISPKGPLPASFLSLVDAEYDEVIRQRQEAQQPPPTDSSESSSDEEAYGTPQAEYSDYDPGSSSDTDGDYDRATPNSENIFPSDSEDSSSSGWIDMEETESESDDTMVPL